MSSFGLLAACVWSLSVAPLVLEFASGGELSLDGAPRFVPVALPWLALAGVPRRRGSTLPVLTFGLPPLALALGLDLAEGPFELGRIRVPLGTCALAVGWAQVAQLARTRPDRQRFYDWIWFFLVVLVPVCQVSHQWAPHLPAPEWASLVASLSPLTWLHAAPEAASPLHWARPFLGLLAAACFVTPYSRRWAS